MPDIPADAGYSIFLYSYGIILKDFAGVNINQVAIGYHKVGFLKPLATRISLRTFS